jgi:hypothetical protein
LQEKRNFYRKPAVKIAAKKHKEGISHKKTHRDTKRHKKDIIREGIYNAVKSAKGREVGV